MPFTIPAGGSFCPGPNNVCLFQIHSTILIDYFMSIVVKSLTYTYPGQERLWPEISFSVAPGQKTALVGANGTGKSTLLKILAGLLSPQKGEILCASEPCYVPQHTGQYDHLCVAGALGISEKLRALHVILGGDTVRENFSLLADDWQIEERCAAALSFWGIGHLSLTQSMSRLSGGEKSKVFLAGILLRQPRIILLDEPTNHLDAESRKAFYDFILRSNATLLAASHDRTLLDLFDNVLELTPGSLETYGGNYTFYKEEKSRRLQVVQERLEATENTLRKARQREREVIRQRQKSAVRGKAQTEKSGMPRIMMGSLKQYAQESTVRLKKTLNHKTEAVARHVMELKEEIGCQEFLKIAWNTSTMHPGKVLVKAERVTFAYDGCQVWKTPLDFVIRSGDRLRIEGNNGSGKTTLVRLITGSLQPETGNLYTADFRYLYIDQEYALLDASLTVTGQVEAFHDGRFSAGELRTLMHRHQLGKETWNRKTGQLSGGEKMKLLLCCITAGNRMPDLLILDEPTNNLDLPSQEILTDAVKSFAGTLVVISHDACFIREINADKQIVLGRD